ncbi:MAG: sulfatase [Planctomycetota bacterium]
MLLRIHLLPLALAACLIATTTNCFAEPAAQTSPPNVVMIVVDDLGWADLGCYGSTFYETPRIDTLAREGVRYTDAYASCPVCSPSRASIMTGKYPARIGLTAHIGDAQPWHWRRETPFVPARYEPNMALSETTLAEAFHDAGYATLHAGKWHLGDEKHWPEYQGFDVNAGGWSQGGPFGGKQYFSPYGNPRLRPGPEGEHLTDRLATETVDFITAHRHEPFFVHLSFYSVHVPLVAREDLLKKYQDKEAKLPKQETELVEKIGARERRRQDLPVYAAMVEATDQAIGRVLDTLAKHNLSENTIVMFTSDNGGLSTGDRVMPDDQGWPTTNAPLRTGKGWLYEGGIRVPLIVKLPAASGGATSDRVVTGTDYYRTLCELCEIDVPEGMADDSESFVTSIHGSQEERAPAFWHYPHYSNQGGIPGGAVRDGKWKLVEFYGEAEPELYDLSVDIGETKNLAAEHPEVASRLSSMLADWRADLDARDPTPRVVKEVAKTEASDAVAN